MVPDVAEPELTRAGHTISTYSLCEQAATAHLCQYACSWGSDGVTTTVHVQEPAGHTGWTEPQHVRLGTIEQANCVSADEPEFVDLS